MSAAALSITACNCYGRPILPGDACNVRLLDGGLKLPDAGPVCLDCTETLPDGGRAGLDPAWAGECGTTPGDAGP